ncbi:MAG TPA: redox-regulated ATPase YchF [Dehalococcoidia bacterium]|jgi:GTP-binding protein YchF|nr:redox-regulated ATPase YchF [Dehalococcoidia bacterium]
MEIVIIGLPQSGKSCLFDALTQGVSASSGIGNGIEMRIGTAKVPDYRLDELANIYNPQKIIQAEIKYWDPPGMESGVSTEQVSGRYRNILQSADALLVCIRAFESPYIPHIKGTVDPVRDINTILEELMYSDLEMAENAITRLSDSIKKAKPEERQSIERQQETMMQIKDGIEKGDPVLSLMSSFSDVNFLSNYQFLTNKPIIVVYNINESDPSISSINKIQSYSGNLIEISIPARTESELAQMPEEEEKEFREDLGLTESACDQIIQATYKGLSLISFLTVGEDEVRAWPIKSSFNAPEAAGAIHTDFIKGFVKAEVVSYENLLKCKSWAQTKKEGLCKSEGKTYIVQDGDIINFLINQ